MGGQTIVDATSDDVASSADGPSLLNPGLVESSHTQQVLTSGVSLETPFSLAVEIAAPALTEGCSVEAGQSWKERCRARLSTMWHLLGPGIIMSIGFMDPGNLEGAVQAGANSGYKLLWLYVWSSAMGWFIQNLSGKLGVVSGRHLAQHAGRLYNRALRWLLYVVAEMAVVGADIQETVGGALGIVLLSNGKIPQWGAVLIAATVSYILLLLEQWGVRKLEALFVVLVTVMGVCFCVTYAISSPPQNEVLKGLVIPSLPSGGSGPADAAAIVGAAIMPYNAFLYSALVLSRKLDSKPERQQRGALRYFYSENCMAVALATFVMVCVTSTFAVVFSENPEASAAGVGLDTAGWLLEQKFGTAYRYIWALGLVAAGLSSSMASTYSGQFMMQGLLNVQVKSWLRVLLVRCVALVPCLLVAALANSKSGMDQLNQWVNVLQALVLPFVLVPLFRSTADPAVMGTSFASSLPTCVLAWIVMCLILMLNLYSIAATATAGLPKAASVPILTVAFIVYFCLLALFMLYRSSMTETWAATKQLPGAMARKMWAVCHQCGQRVACCCTSGGVGGRGGVGRSMSSVALTRAVEHEVEADRQMDVRVGDGDQVEDGDEAPQTKEVAHASDGFVAQQAGCSGSP